MRPAEAFLCNSAYVFSVTLEAYTRQSLLHAPVCVAPDRYATHLVSIFVGLEPNGFNLQGSNCMAARRADRPTDELSHSRAQLTLWSVAGHSAIMLSSNARCI